VSLCSADIEVGQIVTSCVGTFLDECKLIDAASKAARASITILRNDAIFREISSRAFRFTGLVAFQKRIRTLLRRMRYPSAGILDAWEIVFDRWLHLSKDVSTTTAEAVAERTVAEWRNYSGFLASLGGICTADQAVTLEEPAISGLRWIDRLSSENHEEPLLNRYLRLSIQLLACANVRIRETMREVLSTEVPPSLYQPLFKALESELDVLFTGALEPSVKGQDNEIVFAEQAASLLKALVERLDTPTDLGAASSLHLGSLTLNFAKFLDGVPDTPSSLRVKIKICQLCEAVTKRKEHLNLRDDVRNRNQLLEYIFSWIARPRSPRLEGMAYEAKGGPGGGRRDQQDETQRVQKDLDKACLRSLAELTFRLPLQPGDGQTDAGTSELKSQMFHQYFNRFLSLLNLEPSLSEFGGRVGEHIGVGGGGGGGGATAGAKDDNPSVADLAITILSNLLSANIDVGLKHSLSIGYHENVEIRTAFVRVLYNILVQGTEFNNLSDAAVNEKYDELLEVSSDSKRTGAGLTSAAPHYRYDAGGRDERGLSEPRSR
jgi:neurofibromin 1